MRPSAGLAAALVAVAVTGSAVAVQVLTPTDPVVAGQLAAPVAAPSTEPGSTSAPSATAARPVGLRIPAIDVAARVVRLGLNPDRTVEVPSNPAETGWYRPGPAPGDAGSAVILGHVDSVDGPAVFDRLDELRVGDRVAVDAADGSTAVFRVVRLVNYPNDRFPAERVYAAPGGGRRLNLVTCSGPFDPEDGYQANLVVYTRQV